MPPAESRAQGPAEGPLRHGVRRRRGEPLRNLNISDPPFSGDLSSPAIADEDIALLARFRERLHSERLEYCTRCKQKWFNLKVNRNGVCQACIRRDAKRREDEPYFFSAENELDFGSVPDHLPELSQVEEMLIARVHVCVDIYQVRGQQYKYRGHVINFLKDVGQVYNVLPRIPEHLDLVLLRPKDWDKKPHVARQFRRQFRVRRACVRQWLDYLIANHPGYRDIVVSQENLEQLPVDGDVQGRVTSEECMESIENDILQSNGEPDGDAEGPDMSAVPNVFPAHTELEMLRQQATTGSDTAARVNPPMGACQFTTLSWCYGVLMACQQSPSSRCRTCVRRR